MRIRSRSPLRIGLAGGGTDIEEYSSRFGGAVLNTAISRYAFTDLDVSEGDYFEFVAADLGLHSKIYSDQFNVENYQCLPLHFAVYSYFMEEFNAGHFIPGSMTTYCNAAVGSGLGSSSTLVVSMLKAWNEYFNAGLDEYAIAEAAYDIERRRCGLAGGKQDQYSASFGGVNFIEFGEKRDIVHPLRVKHWFKCELESSLILHYAGISRNSSNIIDDQRSLLSADEDGRLEHMHTLKRYAYMMKDSLLRQDIKGIRECLNYGWEAKRRTSSLVTNSAINERILFAQSHGAEACKVSGAGGGGYILFYAPPHKAINLLDELGNCYGDTTFFINICDESSQAWTVN